jgi:hypothetical protein
MLLMFFLFFFFFFPQANGVLMLKHAYGRWYGRWGAPHDRMISLVALGTRKAYITWGTGAYVKQNV